jgi:Helix-turn-helix domain
VEHRKADVRTVAACGMSGDDDTARFLHELRQLRNGAGLGHAQLAARAHYPYDSIRAAEVGPSLPDLPVLSAFVRGCGGPTQEWEERWRSLSSSPSLPVSATRQTGRSDAATAGARINSAAPEGDGPDPSVILAALNRVAEEMADPGDDSVPAPPAAQPAPALPSSSFSSVFSSNEPEARGKPTGWDPIRVSSAWPALQYAPTLAEPVGNTSVPGGGSPGDGDTAWGTAPPWGEQPAEAAAATSSNADDLAAAGTRATGVKAAGTSAPVAGAASRGAPEGLSRTAIAAIVLAAVVLLCVVVALLVVLS